MGRFCTRIIIAIKQNEAALSGLFNRGGEVFFVLIVLLFMGISSIVLW